MIHEKLRENLRINRKKKGLTQTQLAVKLGVKVQTYRCWEMGVSNAPILKIIELADFYGTQVNELLGVTEWRKKKKTLPPDPEQNQKLRLWVYIKYQGGYMDCEVEYTNGRFFKDGRDVTEDVTHWQYIPAIPTKNID